MTLFFKLIFKHSEKIIIIFHMGSRINHISTIFSADFQGIWHIHAYSSELVTAHIPRHTALVKVPICPFCIGIIFHISPLNFHLN